MLGAFINGHPLDISNSMPIFDGKEKEDLNTLKTSQIRNYTQDAGSVGNIPQGLYGWFSVMVFMQDNSNGVMILFSDISKIFFRTITGNTWGPWKELAFK